MSTSLKGVIPRLAKAVGMTPAAIYERQRALVRAGLLQARPGRGPGSGVPGDAKSLTTLLISILAAGSLSEVEEQTKLIGNLKSKDARCPVTGKRTLATALTATLSSEELLSRALSVSVKRTGAVLMAEIVFLKKPIDTISDPPTPSDAEWVYFGADHHDFFLKSFAHLTVEASVNIWGIMRGIELEKSK